MIPTAASASSFVNILTKARRDHAFFGKGSADLDWKGLQDLERRRRNLLLVSSSGDVFAILSAIEGTVIPVLLKASEMWISIGVYAIARTLVRIYDDAFPEVQFRDVGYVGTFMTFTLLFFVGHAYSRFTNLHDKSMAMEDRILSVAVMAKHMLPVARARRLVRYMNAAHMLTYVGLTNTYNEANFLRPLNDKHRLLSEEEYARMLEIDPENGGPCYREVVAWALTEINEAVNAGEMNGWQHFDFLLQITAMKTSAQVLFDYADRPPSFFHVHLVFLLTTIYLPLFSIASAVSLEKDGHRSNEVVSALLVFVVGAFIVGTRVLGQKLADPFGSDAEDLSVTHYVEFSCNTSRRILNGANPKPLDPELEDRLTAESERNDPIGGPWMSARP